MRLGVFGGTFNPIHWGHLVLAETAREALRLDRVLFIPAAQPPHKPARDLLPGATRLALIRLAIKGQPAFAASNIELKRLGTSYSIDTLRLLRRRFHSAKLFVLIGQDMLLVRWREWSQIKRLSTIVVAGRPGVAGARREQGLRWLSMPQIEIASSSIRQRIKAGRSIRYLVPAAVERSIQRHRLYR